MSRQKISEFTAKSILIPSYHGLSITSSPSLSDITTSFPAQSLVVKVDQGIKKRGKQGLVKVDLNAQQAHSQIQAWTKENWRHFLVEPFIQHNSSSEQYLALELTRAGWLVSYSAKGGIEVESHWDLVKSSIHPAPFLPPALSSYIDSLIPILEANHLVFIEMNPLILQDSEFIPLDLAVEVDNATSTLPTVSDHDLSDSEQQIAVLDASTPASLKFRLLNPDGQIWMLLSGGGASLVLADEVADLGMGDLLANYGEYSGAPTDDDVYTYTKIILNQMLNAKYKIPNTKKALIIAGGVANFTDVAKTFTGLLRALNEQKEALQKNKVRIFVRRGGPNEEKGLAIMRDFLTQCSLLGSVHGHDTPLTEVVTEIKNYLVGARHASPANQDKIIL